MEAIIGKIAITSAIFAILSLLAIWVRVIDGGEPSESEQVICGLLVLVGAPTTLIAALIYIWI